MFASRLLLLLFCGYINADQSLHCDFDKLSLCDWRNDPQANNVWLEGIGDIRAYMDNINNTVRLLSRTYDRDIEETGCFSLTYTMYSNDNNAPILRIYQKPEYVSLENLVQLSEEAKKTYIIFEDSKNLREVSFNSVANLKKFKDNFQIIIEAMATSYFGFANIDKVAILQRSECDAAISAATNPDLLRCGFSNNFLCGWSNDPQASQNWNAGSEKIYAFLNKINDTVRLLSPTFDRGLQETGCFSLTYNIRVDYQEVLYPTLRVYQKPEYLPLDSFLELSEEAKKSYIILEPKTYTREVYKQWLNSVAVLKKYESDFQIIIEAISTTDFAALNIKSVAILHGSECTVA